MRKSTIGRVWLGGLAAIVAGIAGVATGTVLMLAYGGTWGGAGGGEFTPAYSAFFWWMVGLITAGAFVAAAGGVAQLVAWIGALANTFAFADKTWFIVLAIGGAIGLVGIVLAGFLVMAVYLLMGPDSKTPAVPANTTVPPPATLVPAS
jgi:hypothetical protein